MRAQNKSKEIGTSVNPTRLDVAISTVLEKIWGHKPCNKIILNELFFYEVVDSIITCKDKTFPCQGLKRLVVVGEV